MQGTYSFLVLFMFLLPVIPQPFRWHLRLSSELLLRNKLSFEMPHYVGWSLESRVPTKPSLLQCVLSICIILIIAHKYNFYAIMKTIYLLQCVHALNSNRFPPKFERQIFPLHSCDTFLLSFIVSVFNNGKRSNIQVHPDCRRNCKLREHEQVHGR